MIEREENVEKGKELTERDDVADRPKVVNHHENHPAKKKNVVANHTADQEVATSDIRPRNLHGVKGVMTTRTVKNHQEKLNAFQKRNQVNVTMMPKNELVQRIQKEMIHRMMHQSPIIWTLQTHHKRTFPFSFYIFFIIFKNSFRFHLKARKV